MRRRSAYILCNRNPHLGSHCAGLLSPTQPIFPRFLFWHSFAIFCGAGKNGLKQQFENIRYNGKMFSFFFLDCAFSFYLTASTSNPTHTAGPCVSLLWLLWLGWFSSLFIPESMLKTRLCQPRCFVSHSVINNPIWWTLTTFRHW